MHAGTPVSSAGYDTLRFWMHGGSTGGQHLRLVANGGDPAFSIPAPQASTWTQVDVPLADLGSPTTIPDLYWQDTTGAPQPIYYLDDIALVSSGLPTVTPPPPVSGPALSVNAGAGQHPISPDIYGMNFADETLAAELNLPVNRWGGNSTTRYNWQEDVHNTGMDWYFENIPEDNPDPSQLPNGSVTDRFAEQNIRTGSESLITIPLIGWTPKQRPEGHPYDCGFDTQKYGPQSSVDPWDDDCGSGIDSNGNNLTGNDPTDTSKVITTTFVQDWIRHLIGRYGNASAGGVQYYNLDNEPMLWNSTHRDVHPNPTTYDEIGQATIAYAAAIKAVDPGARTLGPVVWGWCAYFYSALDGCSVGTDHQNHDNKDFVVWYLDQMYLYEQQHGTRILDYLDVHMYPQGNGIYSESEGGAATQALRLRSTRSLWDPTYSDESWIGQPVRLIPRMHEWVDAHYPDTRLAITEYNWGALGHLNGALAQADVLGIFGREGLDLATLWGPPTAGQPGAFAFRMYRNYNGAHGAFGDISVSAASADQEKLAVYAALRSADNVLTIMVINKTGSTLNSTLTLGGFNPQANAQVYRYRAPDLGQIVHAADQTVSASGFSAAFPANSITLLVIPAAGGPQPEQKYLYMPIIQR